MLDVKYFTGMSGQLVIVIKNLPLQIWAANAKFCIGSIIYNIFTKGTRSPILVPTTGVDMCTIGIQDTYKFNDFSIITTLLC